MIYPGETKENWCKRYGIPTNSTIRCPECSETVRMEIPIAMKDYRGLEAEVCPNCGHNSQAFIVVPVSKEKLNLWNKLKDIFISD